MTLKSPTNRKELVRLLKQGEGPTLEFKRSTGELKEGMRTLCAFLNGPGGIVFFGVRPEGIIEGQAVSDRAPLVAGGAGGISGSESGEQVAAQVTEQVTAEVTAQVAAFCREPQPAKAIMAELGLKHWKTFQANYLAPMMAMGILERTIPDKPRSRMQRYRTTEKGLAASKDPERE